MTLPRALTFALVLAGGMLLVSETLANSPPSNGATATLGLSLELGQRDFRSYCAACHGVSGVGDGTIAEFLTLTVPDLTRLTKKNGGIFPRERVMGVIDGREEVRVHGARDMPVWGDWFDQEAVSPDTDKESRELIVRDRIDSLVGYIESIQAK